MDFVKASDVTLDESYYWRFKKARTVIQTMRIGRQKWELAYIDDGTDPEYWLEIDRSPESIVEAIAHVSDKAWVDRRAFLNALLPAIRTIAWRKDGQN
jgi:hypothetical protein